MRRLLLVVTIALFSTSLHAAGRGERCKVPPPNLQYTCTDGTVCRQSIRNSYCSDIGRECGWKGTGGYYLTDDKTYKGKKYICNVNGFKLAFGERCEMETSDAKLTCATNARCLLAISKSYCSGFNKDCGWRNTSGVFVGQQKQWKDKEYECFINGFQELESDATPVNPPLMGLGTNVTLTHVITSDSDLRALVAAADTKLGFSGSSPSSDTLCFIRWDNNTYYGPPLPYTNPRGVQFCVNSMLPGKSSLIGMRCHFRAFWGLRTKKLANGWKLVAAQVELPNSTEGHTLQYTSRPVEKGNQSLGVDITLNSACLQLKSVTMKGPGVQWLDAFK